MSTGLFLVRDETAEDQEPLEVPAGLPVASGLRRRALPHFADLTRQIIRISPVFEGVLGLLICGLKVRFLPGSPLPHKD
jgi:hypothetical protein